MKLAWATDIHMDHASESARRQFCQSVHEQADALVVTGDIAESDILGMSLDGAGNPDREAGLLRAGQPRLLPRLDRRYTPAVGDAVEDTQGLVYLTQSGAVELTASTALVGHDGWADGRLGDLDHSEVILNDFLLIAELTLLARYPHPGQAGAATGA